MTDKECGMNRKRLSDILNGTQKNDLSRAWETTEAAEDFAPLPPGTYIARVVTGELATANSGTPGYKLNFRVVEGEYVDRQFWHDLWLTPAALPMAKRDLSKLGITALEQLEGPLPPGIRVKVRLALRREDDGLEYNRVKTFEVIGVDPIVDDTFGPVLSDAPTPGEGASENQPPSESPSEQLVLSAAGQAVGSTSDA
jgi:hypothetical protein